VIKLVLLSVYLVLVIMPETERITTWNITFKKHLNKPVSFSSFVNHGLSFTLSGLKNLLNFYLMLHGSQIYLI